MPVMGNANLERILGTDAVLFRLEHLGRNPRTFPNLVASGFPARQLLDAQQWYAESAETPVDLYASRNMARGFFEDESLLKLLCRYYECTDWKLEKSPWFFSAADYDRFFSALIEPVEFQTRLLEQGLGMEKWERYFLKPPMDIAMGNAKTALWEEIARQDHYWRHARDYTQLRAEALFTYLQRTIDLPRFSTRIFNYDWEEVFRNRFQQALHAFELTLENAVRLWREFRRDARGARSRQGRGGISEPSLSQELMQAFSLLGLSPDSVTRKGLQRTFRRLSKETHPDQGGSTEAFRRLSRSKELVEAWIDYRSHRPGSGGD